MIKNIFFYFVGYLSDALSLYLSHHAVADVFDQWFYDWDSRILLALEPNSERIKGRFIETVFKNALPAALTDFILIFSLVLLSSTFGMRSEELSSAAICLMAFVGFTIIYQESQPLNHYKRLVLLGNILAFLVSSSILGKFFNMSP